MSKFILFCAKHFIFCAEWIIIYIKWGDEGMVIAAVVCEYNPFHSGHKYHIEETRRRCAPDAVVAVMSGNWVQRGEAALFDKRARAAAAVMGGADLVLELPAYAAVRSAEFFAASAVKIIDSLGAEAHLSFGAETADTQQIVNTAEYLANEPWEFSKRVKELSSEGMSYAAARSKAAEKLLGSAAAGLLAAPNNILGVEYCKACVRLGGRIQPMAIQRIGAAHDSDETCRGFASAGMLRARLSEGDLQAYSYMPEFCRGIFEKERMHLPSAYEKAVIAEIIKMPPERLRRIADVTEGLENRIKRTAQDAKTLDELALAVKTKRYAHSRIRRILLAAYLGIEKCADPAPPYVKILAHSEKGCEVIRELKKTARLPLVRNTAQINRLGDRSAKEYWERERIYDTLYELF